MHDNLHYGERKKISTLITVFFILLLWQGVPFAFANTSSVSDKEKLERLEGRVELQEERLKSTQDNYNEYKVLLEKRFKKKEEDLEKRYKNFKEDMEKEYSLFMILLVVFGSTTLLGIGTGIFTLLKSSKKYTTKKINEKIIGIIDEKKDEVERSVKDSGITMDLEAKKRIMIIANKKEESKDLRDFLRKLKFQNVIRASIDDIEGIKKTDLVLFDNEKGGLSFEKISEIADQTRPNTVCFYFGGGRYDNPKIKDRLNFANSRMQLYGNLINSLRYQGTL